VATFGKEPDRHSQNVHTVAASVLTWDVGSKTFDTPSDFLHYEEAEANSAIGLQVSSRHRVLDSKTAPDKSLGPKCVKYDYTVEDTGVPSSPGSPFILAMHGYRCVHPKWPRYLIDVSYSERYLNGEQPFHIEAEVAPFLGSLTFADDRPLFVTTIPVGNGPQGVVAAFGGIWVAYGDDGVVRIDPATNQVAAKIKVGRDPVGVAAGSGSIWVANRADGTVSRIDPATNQVAATVSVGGNPLTLAAGDASIWATNVASGEVVRIDPATNRAVVRIAVGPEPNCLAVDSTAVWVTLWHEAKLMRIDPATNRVVASIPVPRGAGDVALGHDSVWVANQYDGMVTRVDPRTNGVLATIALQTRPSGIAVAPDFLWVTRYDESSIFRIDPRTNQPVGRPIAVGVQPVLMTFSDGAFWVTNNFSGSVSRVDL
jgi:YVTN family beta-propeller protein